MPFINHVDQWQVHHRTRPFSHFLMHGLLPDEGLSLLKQAYPTSGFTQAERLTGSDKTYQMDVLKVVDKGHTVDLPKWIDPVWQGLVADLTGERYLDALSEACGLPLNTSKVDVTFFRFRDGGGISSHLDHPGKLATQIFYFNEAWLDSWGGGLVILNSQDAQERADVLYPRLDRSVLLVRGERSWHCVEPTSSAASTPRMTLQLEFWK
ncbi:MAG: 2OG-Fe(II) oxygenase [Rubrivivax sp.]